jgi:flagellar FliJ protein
MSDHSSLDTLLDHARRVRDQAHARQTQARAGAQAAQRQAEQLCDYRNSTQQRWTQQFQGGGAAINLVQCYQGFVGRLQGAVELQGRQVERLRAEVTRAEADTLAAEIRVAALEKLIARRVAEQRIKTEKREQKQLDEHASRLAWQQAQGQGDGARGWSADVAELEWQ